MIPQPTSLVPAYLFGSYLLYLVLPSAVEPENPATLALFVLAAYGAFVVGNRKRSCTLGAKTLAPVALLTKKRLQRVRWILVLACLHSMAYGIILLDEYGGLSADKLIAALSDPGKAYLSKFDIYKEQALERRVNTGMQLVVLTSVLWTLLVPLAVVTWARLRLPLKTLIVVSVGARALFFLFTGTMKGLGDICILWFAGLCCKQAGYWRPPSPEKRGSNSWSGKALVALTIAVGGYMAINQLQRSALVGTEARYRRLTAQTSAASLVGEDAALGLYMVLAYPTHGYVGLSKNLQTEFSWAYGLGSSRALGSYLTQYLNIPDMFQVTYPARTEARTGWPALMYWCTIFPWLASDVTFPGTIVLMYILGAFLSKVWGETTQFGSILSLAIFGQLCILIAYIPANNQLLQSRDTLISTLTLLAVYGLRELRRTQLARSVRSWEQLPIRMVN